MPKSVKRTVKRAKSAAKAARRPKPKRVRRRSGEVFRKAFDPGSAAAVKAVERILATAASPATHSPILIHGSRASAKTTLLAALASGLRDNGVRYVRIDGTKPRRGPAHARAIRELAGGVVSVVIVHNLGALAASPGGEEVCSALTRMAAERRHVVAASEFPPAALLLPEAFRRVLRRNGLVMEIGQSDQPTAHAAVLEKIAAHFGVSVRELVGAGRQAAAVHARHVGMYVLYNGPGRKLSLPEVGRVFGRSDHTTALHAVRKIQARLTAGDRALARQVAALRRRLGIAGR